MKKGISFKFLISASALLVLTSCNDVVPGVTSEPATTSEESITSLDTSSSEVSIGVSSEIGGTSTPEESSGKGDYNTSILQNAVEESLKKNGMRMEMNQPSLQLGLSSYTVLGTAPNYNLVKGSTNNVVLQSTSQTLEVTKNSLLGLTGMRFNINNLSLVAGSLSLAGSALPAQNLINQDMNLYYKNNTFYWDFLDENGQECTGLSALADLAFSAAMSASGDSSDIEFQHKGKYELDSDTQSLMMLISLLPSLIPGAVDSVIQSLWQGGAEITTTSSKVLGETIYDMSIKTSDPSVLIGGTSGITDTAGSLVGGLTDSLPVDVSDTDGITADYFTSFDFEMHFGYTVDSLRSMSMTLNATADETKVMEGILDDEDLEAGDTKLGLSTIQMSQTTNFTFDNSISITYPSFDTYVTQELPATEEPVEEPISSEPTSSEPLTESLPEESE
ncbi:MAG: hypothetical protein IKQ34_00945 [Bacilli bacterium]|nr:hypothetical protein [Bacilli bacterium]MBR6056019.1 hypothetical protein [Bacilli bacterium]